MAKHRYSDGEARLALETYFKEAGLDYAVVRSPRLAHLIVVSVGRVYLRHWTAMDAAGVSHLEGPEGPDGPPSFVDGYDLIRRIVAPTLKWRQRAQWFHRQHSEGVRHVVDWLDAAVHDNAPWLSNVDERGRPRKIMKCGTIERLEAEADKAMMKALQSPGVRAVLPKSDEKVVVTLGDLSLVRLLTPKALDAESAAMRHCIGLGSYDDRLSLPGLGYYSVRDADNRPIATIENMDGVVLQCSGPKNSFTTSSALDFLHAIRASLGWISRDEHMIYTRRRHELSPEEIERIGTVVERGRLTSEERRAVIEERELRLPDRGYEVADDRIDHIFGRPPRP